MRDWFLILLFLAGLIVVALNYDGFWTEQEVPNRFEIWRS